MDKIEIVTLYDGATTKIKYSYPEYRQVDKLVIYVNGSGPSTYDNKRRSFDGNTFYYHDFFRNKFVRRGIAYCSYNTRGVDLGDIEPLFIQINDAEYKKYLPSNSVKDVESIISHLTDKPIFKNTKIYLLGWSEGSIIAPLVALNKKVRVDALLLAGYVNENMKDTMIWQLSGNSSYLTLQRYFDVEKKGYISKQEFEEDRFNVRKAFFGDAAFENFDADHDGKISIEDFAVIQKPYLDSIFNAIESNDDEWLKNNYGNRAGVVLKSAWFKEHFSLKPNKEVLPLLNLPIFIFHGEYDANCPQQYALDIEKTFACLHKNNLEVNIFKNHDHDLNFAVWLMKKTIPEGIACIFDTVEAL